MKQLRLPLSTKQIKTLKAGDIVYLSGKIYTARDAAHQRLYNMIHRGETLPFPLKDACIYYTGPCPKKPGQVINSCGPTTSSRMDKYAPVLYDMGVRCVIGKGPVASSVVKAIVRNDAVYFAATGGAGALIAGCVRRVEPVAFLKLGAEAVQRLTVKDFPLIVAVDSFGSSVYKQ